MENKINIVRGIDRKKFFLGLSKVFAALLVIGLFPFSMFGKDNFKKKIEIKINPLAVKREKDTKKDAR